MARWLVASIAVVLAILGSASVAVRIAHSDRILPGTVVAGADVGGLTIADARARLARASSGRFLVGDAEIAPARAGLRWNVDATVSKAKDRGRRGPALGVFSTLQGLIGDRHVDPVVSYDSGRLQRVVADLADRYDRPADQGRIRVDPGSLQASIDPSRDGRRVRRTELRTRLRRAARTPERRRIQLPFSLERAVELDDLEAAARRAERYLTKPLRLAGGGRTVRIAPSRLAPALTTTAKGTSPPRVQISVPRDRLRPALDQAAAELERPARAPRFERSGNPVRLKAKLDVRWRPRSVPVEVTAGRSGRAIDIGRTTQAIGDAIRAGRHRARVRFKRDPPVVSSPEAQRVNSVIGTFTTRYQPGEPRVRNIRRMAEAVDGTVIAPGAQFSLNDVAGPRTREKGYVPAPFISDGKIVPSVGGGVSQFSTTLYNAAYFAGLRLDTSQSHSLYIDRYPPGREATLDFRSIDLRWTNDTKAPVVVQATGSPTAVTVTLLGDNGGRRVRSETGRRQPAPGGDFQITVTRIVRYADGRVVRQPRITRYDLEVL